MEKRQIFFIPEKLKIGFQKRSDAYTGKLSYITYYDSKGVLRKESSWDSWRDSSIDPIEIENKPTSGFILNRHVGGYKNGWNYRQSYCRVWDPRGFEIEITIDNLLWILEHCNSNKKVLSGEFVYAWEGKSLVLVPTVTGEYKDSLEISRKKPKKLLSTSDLIPGTLYKMKVGTVSWKMRPVLNNSHDFIFIGKVRMQKDIGKRYESACLFKSMKKDIFAIFNPSDIDYIVDSDIVGKDDIDLALYRFKISAFSWDFWNEKEELIKDLLFNKTLSIDSWAEEMYHDVEFFEQLIKFSPIVKDSTGFEFDYYQRTYNFIKSVDTKTRHYRQIVKEIDLDTPRCRFRLESGRLKEINEFINPGKINHSLIKSNIYEIQREWDISNINIDVLDPHLVYPKLKKPESLQPKDDSVFGVELFPGEKEKVYYKTVTGYVDSGCSLHYSLAFNDGLHDRIKFFRLPEKENKE